MINIFNHTKNINYIIPKNNKKILKIDKKPKINSNKIISKMK